ncbi:MAG: hypothetical protein P8Z81_03165 [Deinococcales bacterium]
MAILMWLGISLAALVVLLLLLVCLLLLVPVALDATWGEERRVLALSGPGLRLAFDLRARTTELRLFSLRIGRWSMGARRRRPKRPRKRKRKPRRRMSWRRLWRQRGRFLVTLRAFFRRVKVRRLQLQATIATPDPAATGWLVGAAYAVRAVAPPRVQRNVALEPDFSTETPRLALDASLRLMPLHAAILALRMWLVMRRARPRRARGGGGDDRATTRRKGGGRE